MKYYKCIFFILIFVITSCSNDENTKRDYFESIHLQEPDGLEITNISFSDNLNGVICGSFGFLAKTTDGGKNWVNLNVGVNQTFLSTFMINNNTIFVGRLGLYKSDNSGISFYETGNLNSTGSAIFEMYFNDLSTGFIAQDGLIKKTTDGGTTWDEKYYVSPFYGITNFEITSANVGYASGGATFDTFNEGQIAKTIDAGENWTTILNSSNISSISFINDNVGFYSNFEKELYKTVDGGESWNKIHTFSDYLTDILFAEIDLGYVATQEGKILITEDGGNTWRTVYDKTTITINRLYKTSNHIFAVGNDGLLLRSN